MIDEIFQEVIHDMEKAVEALSRDLATIRTGRASTAMLSGVRVDYYGSSTPLNQVANLSIPEPRMISIKPWEQNMIPVIERAIRADSRLGLNPSNDGNLIRVSIPELTEERRREISKSARQRAEEGRVAVRHARREGINLIDVSKKEGEISEDEARQAHTRIQKITDEYVGKVDKIVKNKEKEIMEV